MAVPGLSYVARFVAEPDEARLLTAVDGGQALARGRRVSLTFRTVLLEDELY
jgi:hypothetical protein